MDWATRFEFEQKGLRRLAQQQQDADEKARLDAWLAKGHQESPVEELKHAEPTPKQDRFAAIARDVFARAEVHEA